MHCLKHVTINYTQSTVTFKYVQFIKANLQNYLETLKTDQVGECQYINRDVT